MGGSSFVNRFFVILKRDDRTNFGVKQRLEMVLLCIMLVVQ